MSQPAIEPKPKRREQAIRHAADLLREGGPSALTSVAVAERMGITQSAVYRHISDMDELSSLAATVLVEELYGVLENTLLDPGVDWKHTDDVDHLCRAVIDVAVAHSRSYAVVDQWRFVGGSLGIGIENMVEQGRDVVAILLESRWRIEFGHEPALRAAERVCLLRHAQAVYDDGYAIARLARSSPFDPHLNTDEIADILKYRILAGWSSFAIDMNERVGLPFPKIDLDRGIVVH